MLVLSSSLTFISEIDASTLVMFDLWFVPYIYLLRPCNDNKQLWMLALLYICPQSALAELHAMAYDLTVTFALYSVRTRDLCVLDLLG